LYGDDHTLTVAVRKVDIFSESPAIADGDCILYARFLDMCGNAVTFTYHHNK